MLAEVRQWTKGDDGLFHPTPPYREGEIVGCEGCGSPVKVSKYVELHQFANDDCKACADAEDAYVMGGASD